MKPRTRKTGATGTAETKPAFVVPADFTPKQAQVVWEEFLKAQPTTAEQPKPRPEIRMSDHLSKLRSDTPPLIGPTKKQGRPRRDLEKSGVHLILWGTFQRVRKKSPKVAEAWSGMAPQARKDWFMACALLCFSSDPGMIGSYFARAYLSAPDATLAILPVMRATAKNTETADYRAWCYGWKDEDAKTMKMFSATERDIRRRCRNALAEFVAETG